MNNDEKEKNNIKCVLLHARLHFIYDTLYHIILLLLDLVS